MTQTANKLIEMIMKEKNPKSDKSKTLFLNIAETFESQGQP